MSEHVSERLKRAIRESGMSRYAISQASGVDQATLSKFMSGQRGLTLDSVDKLAGVLGLEMRLITEGKRKSYGDT